MAFWDSSAIVPLCINEVNSQSDCLFWRRFPDRFVWREAPVEIASAIAKRLREQSITANDKSVAESRFLALELRWAVVETTDRCIELRPYLSEQLRFASIG